MDQQLQEEQQQQVSIDQEKKEHVNNSEEIIQKKHDNTEEKVQQENKEMEQATSQEQDKPIQNDEKIVSPQKQEETKSQQVAPQSNEMSPSIQEIKKVVPEDHKAVAGEDIMQLAISQRKKDTWELLKEWDKQRIAFLSLHLKLIEILFKYLDEFSQQSQQIISILIEYFTGRSKQEITYKQQNVDLIINLEGQNQQQEFFVGLKKVSDKQKEKAEQSGILGELLQQKAINVLAQEFQSMSQALGVHRGKIIHSKQQLNVYFNKLTAKEAQLMNYQQSQQPDLFLYVTKWLKFTEKLKEQQRILAKDICKFQIIVEEMKKRRETMLNQILEDVFNNKVEKQQPTGIILKEVFNEEELMLVKGWINKEVQWQELNVFFEEFSIKEAGVQRYLLLKQMKVIGKEYEYVSVTVDGSILCVLRANKIKVLAHVSKSTAIRKQQIVEIDILQEGFLWNKVEKIQLTMENADAAEELIEVIGHSKHLLRQNEKK